MQVTMKIQISGTRNGVDWPPVGGVMELPDDEAHDLIARGRAEAAVGGDSETATPPEPETAEPAEETATPPEPETATTKRAARKRG